MSARLRLRSVLPDAEEAEGVGEGIDIAEVTLLSLELGVVSVFVARNDIVLGIDTDGVTNTGVPYFKKLTLPVTLAIGLWQH